MGKRLAIPQYLDYRQWEKHKGIIAKIVKRETGITKALQEFENAYLSGGFGWGLVDDSSLNNYIAHLDGISISSLESGLDRCKGKEAFLSKVQAKLNVVKRMADDNAKEFKENRAIPSSSRVFLENMSKACTTFVGEVRKQIEHSEKRISEALKKAGVFDGVRLPTDLNPGWWKEYMADRGEYLTLVLGSAATDLARALGDYWAAWKECQDPRRRCMSEYRKARAALENAQKAVMNARSKQVPPNVASALSAYLPLIQKALLQIDTCIQDYKKLIDHWADTRVEIRDGMRMWKQKTDVVVRKSNAAADTAEQSVKARDLEKMKRSLNLAKSTLQELINAKQSMDTKSRDLFGKAQHLPTKDIPHPDDFPDGMKDLKSPWNESLRIREQMHQDCEKTENRLKAVISQLSEFSAGRRG